MPDNFYAKYPATTGSGSGVTSLNTLTGALDLLAGSNVTITPGSGTLTISSTGGSSTPLAIEYRTVTAGENTAKQLTLGATPLDPTKVILAIAGAPTQVYGTDFTVSGTTLSWNGTALDGILSTGDQLLIEYNV
jgi:hypothetical protein